MSDQIKHECGIAFIRLLKPLEYYLDKYGTVFYGLNRLQVLMQKQRNRGQDGAGLATIKLNPEPGTRYISRKRSNSNQALKEIFDGVLSHFEHLKPNQLEDVEWLKKNMPYIGEVMLGHLRYGTHGNNSIEAVHPFLRQNNWMNRNLVLAGNFNLTNVDELFDELVNLGQHPKEKSDTVTMLEKIGHFLDDEVQRIFDWYKHEGLNNVELNKIIEEKLDLQTLLRRACKKFDGGYVMAGLIGHGDSFIIRDPNGIRPAFYYMDDEIVVAASERPAIMTACDIQFNDVKELEPGHGLFVKKDGRVMIQPFIEKRTIKQCSFERIYFSRGNDKNIYTERKRLGEQLAIPILKSVDFDMEHTVFSFIPNTAESAFFGMVEGLNNELNKIKQQKILKIKDRLDAKKLEEILSFKLRVEKIAVKDEKLRTFIADDASRNDMVSHVYDVTYGIVENEVDNLVLIDDSIVRGTTLKNSIIKILARLKPKKIVIVSSAPQIRYPDCYGIDMSKLGEFVAFKAMVSLIKERNLEEKLEEAYWKCKEQEHWNPEKMINHVKSLYDLFSYDEVTKRIGRIITPDDIKPEVEIIFQNLEGLRTACPNHTGDWYFSGDYPTPGGNKVVNQAFINYMENKNIRAY
jgi:amidophosphoribosyltransferase